MWRAYRLERQRGSSPREAVTHAFERHPQFRKSDTLEQLRELLADREARYGLTLTEAEHEEEILREAAALDDTPPEPGSAAAIQADAHRRAGELRRLIEDMAPEALGDAKVAARQRTAESELADVEHTLANLSRAPRVIAQREQSAAEQAEREAREQADLMAQELVPTIAGLKGEVDRAANAWAASVERLRDATEQRVEHVARATGGDNMAVRGARFRDWDVLSALRAATRGHHLRIDELAPGPRDTLLVPPSESGE